MKKIAAFTIAAFIYIQIAYGQDTLLPYKEVADSTQKIYVGMYSPTYIDGKPSWVLQRRDSTYATKFIPLTVNDTVKFLYKKLNQKPFIMKYRKTNFKTLCIAKDSLTIEVWGIDTLTATGIYFIANRTEDGDEILYRPTPVVQWIYFDWENNPGASEFLRWVLQQKFTYEKITFDNLGTYVPLQVMIPLIKDP